MNSRPQPVRGRRTFAALVRSRRRARSGAVTVHFLPSEEEVTGVAVAYSISRNVGNAVVRNRWRRRLRVIAAEVAPELQSGAYLIGVNPDVTVMNFSELRERVINTMRGTNGRR